MAEVDGVNGAMEIDGYRVLLEGFHRVSADKPLVLEVLGDANTFSELEPEHGYDDWGSYLIPVQSIGLSYPEPQPIGGFGELFIYIIVGVVAVVAIVAVVVLRMRRKP